MASFLTGRSRPWDHRRGELVRRTLFSRETVTGLAFCAAILVNLGAPSLTRAMCGDVNGDGVVNIGDALIVAQYDVGLRTCGQTPFSHAEMCDVNGDGACNIGDALKMAQCDVEPTNCPAACGPFTCSSSTTTTARTTSTTTTTTVPLPCTFVLSWGVRAGGHNGQVLTPYGVATDASGNVYVADTGNDRIQKFDPTGAFITTWGGTGYGAGQFRQPYGIGTSRGGYVYVSDTVNRRIQKFDANGKFVAVWGFGGYGDGQFVDPAGIATDAAGNVYVADSGNDRIQKFDSSGTFLVAWGYDH